MITLSSENSVAFLKTCISLDKEMGETLKNWSTDADISSILEEYPYLDESSALFILLEDNLKNVFEYADSFIRFKSMFFDSKTSTPGVLVSLYFESPSVEYLRKIMDTGASVSDEVIYELKGQFESARLNLKHFINKCFDFCDYPGGEAARIFESYESQYGSIKDYVLSVIIFCDDNPMFFGESINAHYDFFVSLLDKYQEVNREEFAAVSEAVMPWDIYLLKNNIVEFGIDYLKKLKHRTENPTSILNSVPIIRDVIDKLPESLYKKMYDYEDLVGLSSIEMIKSGKTTFEKIFNDLDKIQFTSFF